MSRQDPVSEYIGARVREVEDFQPPRLRAAEREALEALKDTVLAFYRYRSAKFDFQIAQPATMVNDLRENTYGVVRSAHRVYTTCIDPSFSRGIYYLLEAIYDDLSLDRDVICLWNGAGFSIDSFRHTILGERIDDPIDRVDPDLDGEETFEHFQDFYRLSADLHLVAIPWEGVERMESWAGAAHECMHLLELEDEIPIPDEDPPEGLSRKWPEILVDLASALYLGPVSCQVVLEYASKWGTEGGAEHPDAPCRYLYLQLALKDFLETSGDEVPTQFRDITTLTAYSLAQHLDERAEDEVDGSEDEEIARFIEERFFDIYTTLEDELRGRGVPFWWEEVERGLEGSPLEAEEINDPPGYFNYLISGSTSPTVKPTVLLNLALYARLSGIPRKAYEEGVQRSFKMWAVQRAYQP